MKIREIMTPAPVAVMATDTVTMAATAMKDSGIGAVPVIADGVLAGILTDRDIAIRVLARGLDPALTRAGDVRSAPVAVIDSDEEVGSAIRLMRERAVRRVPVIDGGTLVGIVSIGDMALTRDEQSVLADVSAAPPNT
jgi:CBS domain-containing protein